MKDGYPERVCDYCHSQLNTFHAFVKKAKSTSDRFENILNESKIVEENDTNIINKYKTLLSTADLSFETCPDDEVEEMEFFIDKTKVDLTSTTEEIPIENDEDGMALLYKSDLISFSFFYLMKNWNILEKFVDEYAVEYLEPEYMNTFVNEIKQNEENANDEDENSESNKQEETPPKPKNQFKRKYPYKCKKCGKRFVYKEVYEAHIRIHKGLPGFSYDALYNSFFFILFFFSCDLTEIFLILFEFASFQMSTLPENIQ